jgi:lysophospholipid acyltransferase (LPLAT)-like uncharacterized protein
MVLWYLRQVARSSRCGWLTSRGDRVDSAEVNRKLIGLACGGQPLILSYYIEDALGIATLALMHAEFLRLMRTVRCLIDQTVAGRVSAAIIENLGGRYVSLPHVGDPNRLREVHAVITEGGSCAFPVDGGGPYRQVGTGIVGLAASLNAVIVPIAVRVAPAVTFAPQSKVQVPWPRGRLVAAIGDDVRVRRGGDRGTTAATLKEALDGLSAAVRRAV